MIPVLNNGAAECFGNVHQALLQQVAEVNQQRSAKSALAHAGNHFIEVDRDSGIALRMHHHVSRGIDIKESLAPIANRIERCRLLDTPPKFGRRSRGAGAGCGDGSG